MAKTSAISVRVPDDIKAAAEKAAAADSRSVASLVEKVLTEWLRKTGYLQSEQHPDEFTRAYDRANPEDPDLVDRLRKP